MSIISVDVDSTGTIDYTGSDTDQSEDTTGTTDLDKEAFLELLCTQMQYQDPLDPADNTEFVAELAQFSALEQMTNLNETVTNQTGYDLVGEYVIMAVGQSDDDIQSYVSGTVDYTELVDGTVYLSIDGSLYDINDLYSVVDADYVASLSSE